MEHFSHEHPLLLSDDQEQQKDDGGEEISCSGCCLPLSSSGGGDPTYYNCIQCKYFLHKSCAELPHKIIHFLHRRHPLTLFASAPNRLCDKCREKILGFIYQCSLCDFDLDIKCASTSITQEREMEHFSHEHPLLLSDHLEQQKDEDDGSKEISCRGCRLPLSSSGGGKEISCRACRLPLSSSGGGYPTYYNCIQCKYFLHKSCAELPDQIIYFQHPRHPLTLLASATKRSHCYLCAEDILGFIYQCSLCDFYLDIKCHSPLGIVQAEAHKHSFMLLKPMVDQDFICDACGEKIKGMSYLCTTCQFWVHEWCIRITKTIKFASHSHQLDLSYSASKNQICYICNFPITATFYFYSCSICTYAAHLSCAFALKDENKEPIPLDLLPNNIDSTSITQDFSTIVKLEENQIATAELKHFTHRHLLVLGENDLDCDKKYCEGCSWPIFDLPFYTCSQCNSHLHKACAELPRKISHQLHRHPLTLCFDEPNEVNIHRTFKCNGCETICNGFSYSCDICNFSIDVRCSLVTPTLEHKTHEHTLRLWRETIIPVVRLGVTQYIHPCMGCAGEGEVLFRCEENCRGVKLDLRCATLPYTTKHRCPKHNWEFYPFHLTFGSKKCREEGTNDTNYCDVCEEKRSWKNWFYYCEDCDYSAHPSCVLSNSPNKSKRF